MTRRQTEAALKAAEARLYEAQVLLAALAIEYGDDARLRVSQERIEDVMELAEARLVAVRRLDTGDIRIDFCEPVTEAPVCQ